MTTRVLIGCAGLLLAGACAQPPAEPARTEWRSESELRYVLGTNPDTGEVFYGGSHRVEGEGGQALALDRPNDPARLHPALGRTEYMRFDAGIRSGQTSMTVYASSWWPQETNGIAWRWTAPGTGYGTPASPDTLSPAEKYDRLFHSGAQYRVPQVEHWHYHELQIPASQRPPRHTHPEVIVGPATAWELMNHGVYQNVHPDHWWGHCSGWASYAASGEAWPVRDIRVRRDGNRVVECDAGDAQCVLVRAADIEALMAEIYFSDTVGLAGRRCNQRPEDIRLDEHGRVTQIECWDLNPGSLHAAVTGVLGKGVPPRYQPWAAATERPAIVVDYAMDFEVWSFPLTNFELLSVQELTAAQAAAAVGATSYVWNPQAERFVRVRGRFTMVSTEVSAAAMLRPAHERGVPTQRFELNYVLELDADGTILGGEWIGDPSMTWNSKLIHPDFFWLVVSHVGYGRENPWLQYARVRQLLDCANQPATCAP